MPDSNEEPTSPAEGTTSPQDVGREPDGSAQAANGGSAEAEATANGGEQPATRESESSTPQPGEADAELEAFLKEGSEGEAPTTDQTAEPSQALDPEGEQEESTPLPPDKDESDPTPEELKRGHVPVSKLTRALEARKKARTETEKLTKELQRESAFTDKLLERFDQVGVPPEELATFLARLHKAKAGDASARSELTAFIGAGQPSADGYTEEEVAAALTRAVTESFDVDKELAALKAAKAKRRETAPPPPPRKAEEPPRNTRTVDTEILTLKAEVAGMGKTLVATHGPKVAAEISGQVETAVQRKLEELEQMGVTITPKVHANAYRTALGAELARRSQKRPAAPRSVRPARLAPPARPMTADEEFAALSRGEIE